MFLVPPKDFVLKGVGNDSPKENLENKSFFKRDNLFHGITQHEKFHQASVSNCTKCYKGHPANLLKNEAIKFNEIMNQKISIEELHEEIKEERKRLEELIKDHDELAKTNECVDPGVDSRLINKPFIQGCRCELSLEIKERRETLDKQFAQIVRAGVNQYNDVEGLESTPKRIRQGMTERIILEGPDQNMTIEEYKEFFVESVKEVKLLTPEEVVARKHKLLSAIHRMQIDMQAVLSVESDLIESSNEEARKALYEYDKKYKSKAKEKTEKKNETAIKYEKTINSLMKAMNFSRQEAEDYVKNSLNLAKE